MEPFFNKYNREISEEEKQIAQKSLFSQHPTKTFYVAKDGTLISFYKNVLPQVSYDFIYSAKRPFVYNVFFTDEITVSYSLESKWIAFSERVLTMRLEFPFDFNLTSGFHIQINDLFRHSMLVATKMTT